MQFYPALIFPDLNHITTQWVVYVVVDELKLISAFLLAIAIYQNVPQTLEKDKFGRDLNHKRVIA